MNILLFDVKLVEKQGFGDYLTVMDDLAPPLRSPTPFKRPRGNPNWIKQNPGNGRPPAVFQDPGQRARYLLHKYGPDEVINLATQVRAGKINKTKLSTLDAMLIVQMGNILQSDGLERERLWDRIFGKVPDRNINLNANLDISPEELSQRAKEMLARISD